MGTTYAGVAKTRRRKAPAVVDLRLDGAREGWDKEDKRPTAAAVVTV
jgi:hypothetical protein